MGKSTYGTASDGLPGRISGPWAREKLTALDNYLSVVLQAMKEKWDATCYIDLMAGCGRCLLKGVEGVEFDGSPLLALRCDPPFTSIVLVEEDANLHAALLHRVGADRRVTMLRGDCNATATIAQMRSSVPPRALSIAFLDNLGLDVKYKTIAALTYAKPMDLIVTFPVSDLTRNAPRAFQDPAMGTAWDEFFGDNTWREAVHAFELKETPAPALASALGDHYARQLGRLGYAHRDQLAQPMMNRTNAALYRVMLFSKHPLGSHLFDRAAKSRRQRRLF